jgi:stalled ribosome rescue protein Dom34
MTQQAHHQTGSHHMNAIIWIDHAQARVIRFDRETSSTRVVHPHGGIPHLHHKANSIDAGHLPEDQDYLHAVAQVIAEVDSVLVTGPANAKLELLKHLERHDAQLAARVSAVQTSDHPTDGELLDLGRRHYRLTEPVLTHRA